MRKSEREPYHAGEMAADRRGKQVAETELSSVSSGRIVGTRRRNKKTTTEESDILPVEDGDTVDSGMRGGHAKKKKAAVENVEMDSLEERLIADASGVSIAPTKVLANKKIADELELYKLKAGWQQERIDELTKERDFLKEQLAAALKKDGAASTSTLNTAPNSSQKHKTSRSSSDDSMETSSDSESESESESDSVSPDSSPDKKKNKKDKKKTGKGKKKVKKSKEKEMGPKARQRALNPKQAVLRYQKILKAFRKGGTMGAAFSTVGVDRNTVVATAPIAELFIAAPNRYKDILDGHKTGRVKLAVFASECSLAIEQDSAIKENVKTLKNNNKLLPLNKK
ncbi:hypothetical protein ABVT39_014283 [Epinephelus coioides]